MPKQSISLLPTSAKAPKTFGENLRSACLRRGITAKRQAERAGISVGTLAKTERGLPAIPTGNSLQVPGALC